MGEKFGLPQKHERVANIESLSEWRELRAEAPAKAAELIEAIPDFEKLDVAAQLHQLKTIFTELQRDNKNRFIGRVIAEKIADLESALQAQVANVAQKNERATMPSTIPADYLGVARMVGKADKQELLPANDNRPSTPVLMRTG